MVICHVDCNPDGVPTETLLNAGLVIPVIVIATVVPAASGPLFSPPKFSSTSGALKYGLTMKSPGTANEDPLIVRVVVSTEMVERPNGAGLVGKVILTEPPTARAFWGERVKVAVTLTGLPASFAGSVVRDVRVTDGATSAPAATVLASLAVPESMSTAVALRVVIENRGDEPTVRPATWGRRTDATVTTTCEPAGAVSALPRVRVTVDVALLTVKAGARAMVVPAVVRAVAAPRVALVRT